MSTAAVGGQALPARSRSLTRARGRPLRRREVSSLRSSAIGNLETLGMEAWGCVPAQRSRIAARRREGNAELAYWAAPIWSSTCPADDFCSRRRWLATHRAPRLLVAALPVFF